MNIKQRLFILFFLKKGGAVDKGQQHLFCRITIDGQRKEISLSVKINPTDWDDDNKLVGSTNPTWKEIEYSITEKGKKAIPVVEVIRNYGLAMMKENGLAYGKKPAKKNSC